jgi:dipeptidyl aminopeptidase/acylaminoacyl peptidase
MPLAERYFSRSSFGDPVVVGADLVAFLDDRSGTKQVSLLTLSTGEIRELTTSPERVLSLLSSVASGRIVFGMDQDGNERQQISVFNSVEGEPTRLTHAGESIHEPGTLSKAGDYVLYRSNARDETMFDIVGVSLDGGEQETWLEGGGQVTPVDMHADGERALIVRTNGNMDGDLLLVAKAGDVTNLTLHDDEQWMLGAAFDSSGTGVWMLSNIGRDFVALMRLDLESRERRVVYEAEWDVELFKVSPDGKQIAISVNEDGASVPMIIAADGDGPAVHIQAPKGVIDRFSWLPDSSRVLFGMSTVEHPSVIAAAGLDGSTRVVADSATGSGVETPKTFAAQTIRYSSFDGLEVPAFFFQPDGVGPFPVLIDIHGGPESQRRLGYSPSGPVLQYLTSLGMAVLSLNVRGSTGYGKAYSHLDDKGKRLDSVKDVEYAVKWLHEREDVIDDKIAVYGRSYGGFMTLAALVFYPDLWAVGVEMVGIANFVSFLQRTGPWRRKHREAEYGELANDREMLERISPLNHIDNIRVPLMVCHGRHDPRVPLFEAEQVVEAVKNQGQDVVLRVYDNEGHALSKLPNVLDAFALMGGFLTKHLELNQTVS